MQSGDTPLPASQLAEQAMPLLERIFSAMLDPRGELCILACTEHLEELRGAARDLMALPAFDDAVTGALIALARGLADDLPRAEFIGAASTAVEQLYEWLHAARVGGPEAPLPLAALEALTALAPAEHETTCQPEPAPPAGEDREEAIEASLPSDDASPIEEPIAAQFADGADETDIAGRENAALEDQSDESVQHLPGDLVPHDDAHAEASEDAVGFDTFIDADQPPVAAVEPSNAEDHDALEAIAPTDEQPEPEPEPLVMANDAADEPAEHAATAQQSPIDDPPAGSIEYDLDLLDTLDQLDDAPAEGSASSVWDDLGTSTEAEDAVESPIEPTGTIDTINTIEAIEQEPDASEPLDPTDSVDPWANMPDPNKPLDPTGSADPWANMPDPNKPLDPTGSADPWASMPDPNKPLDPTGSADPWANMPDPNAPLEPTGEPALLTPEQMAALMAQDAGDGDETWGTTPLMLSPEKGELLQFMVSDVRDALSRLDESIVEIRDVTMRGDCGRNIAGIASDMAKVSEFFDFKSLTRLVEILHDVGARLAELPDSFVTELEIRLRAIATLITQHCAALEVAMEQQWPLSTLARRVDLLLSGKPLHRDLIGWHNGDVDRLLELDRIVEGIDPVPTPESDEGDSISAMAEGSAASRAGEGDASEQNQPTIRVPKDRVEHLLDVVRQLVLSKNQMSRLARALRSTEDRESQIENLNARTEQLDRLIGELQLTLMDTRMQTIDKLFDRYDRVVRDVARLNDKEVTMSAVGGGTKVDKFVLEALSDPLGKLLRFLASHDIETADARLAAGKPSVGRVRVSAENQGSHVRICLRSDGQGLDRYDIAHRARSFGLLGAAEPDSDDDRLLGLLLEARFEDSPLAGLRSTFDALHGEVIITSTPGRGVTIDITLPVTSAVIPAMLVGLGDEVYAIPLQSVLEIVKAGEEIRHEVNGCACVRIRESVLAAVDLAQLLRNRSAHPGGKLAVVVTIGEDRIALLVDRILGHQEIVIEPLDAGSVEAAGPFSGATIRDDGGVSLILDLSRLVRAARSELASLRRYMDTSDSQTSEANLGDAQLAQASS